MIIVMRAGASPAEIEHVTDRVNALATRLSRSVE